MKKLTFTLLLIAGLTIGSFARNIVVVGKINSNTSGINVSLKYLTNSSSGTATATTNGNGQFAHTFNVGTANFGAVSGYLVGCDKDTVANADSFDTRSDTVFLQFNYCDSCKNFFSDFSYIVTGNKVSFLNASATSATSFFWTFGNGDSSILKNPGDKTYSTGTYTVCLTAKKAGCTRTVCIQIKVGNPPPANGGLSGLVKAGTSNALKARVWLITIAIDTLRNDTLLTAVDSLDIDSGYYYFRSVKAGKYLVKAALRSSSSQFNNYLPTYATSSASWRGASAVTVSSNNVANANINLIAGSNSGGSGFIGGYVSQGANKAGDPLEQIQVLLYNAGVPIAFKMTNSNGEFKFENLSFGTYNVVVEVLGKRSETFTANLTQNNPGTIAANFEVNTKEVIVKKSTSSVTKQTAEALTLYPNPAKTEVYLSFEAVNSLPATITLMDMSGKTITTQTINATQGNNQVVLNVASVENGLYLVNINTGTVQYNGRISINK